MDFGTIFEDYMAGKIDKISAIKSVRAVSGYGLMISKNMIEVFDTYVGEPMNVVIVTHSAGSTPVLVASKTFTPFQLKQYPTQHIAWINEHVRRWIENGEAVAMNINDIASEQGTPQIFKFMLDAGEPVYKKSYDETYEWFTDLTSLDLVVTANGGKEVFYAAINENYLDQGDSK